MNTSRLLRRAAPRTGGLATTLIGLAATFFLGAAGCSDGETDASSDITIGRVTSSLVAVPSFGPNPGQLSMNKYVPGGMPSAPRPLVVALHGCSQSPAQYEAAGWNELADAWKFYVVYPGQNSAKNNSLGCFNWGGRWPSAPNAFVFTPEPLDTSEIQRGKGENQSIKEMVDNMKATHAIDPSRVFVTGLSAGGGMAAVLLATWPDVFAGGAIMAGIPYGCATGKKTTEEANACLKAYTGLNASLSRAPSAWGDLVRAASQGAGGGKLPRVSLWAGTADGTVSPTILNEHVKQWTNVHGTDVTPDATNTVDGFPHKEYKDAAGKVVVETYEVTGKSHGTMVAPQSPVDPAAPNGPKCGKAGSFILSAGICSTYHAAKFFGIGPPGSEPPGANDNGGTGPNGSAPGGSTGAGGSVASADGGTGSRVQTPYHAGSTCSAGPMTSSNTNGFEALALASLALLTLRRRRGLARPLLSFALLLLGLGSGRRRWLGLSTAEVEPGLAALRGRGWLGTVERKLSRCVRRARGGLCRGLAIAEREASLVRGG